MSFWGSVAGTIISRMLFGGLMLGGVGVYSNGGVGGMAQMLGGGGNSAGLGAAQASLPAATPTLFYEATARVTAVRTGCRVLFEAEGKLRRTSPMSCTQADHLTTLPEYKGARTVNSNEVLFDYYGPYGKRILEGNSDNVLHNDGRPVRVGDTLPLKVRTDDPRIVNRI